MQLDLGVEIGLSTDLRLDLRDSLWRDCRYGIWGSRISLVDSLSGSLSNSLSNSLWTSLWDRSRA